MRTRPDLLDERSPQQLEVVQLTDDPRVPASHVYMEAQVFTPDSTRFVLHRSADAHGSNQHDPQHQYLLCDLEAGGALTPITDELGATAPSVSPDGRYLYYLVDETRVGGGRLTLKRVNLDGAARQTMLVLDAGLPGCGRFPSWIYPLSTISSDGKRLATAAFLGDGQTEGAPFGLLVFDLQEATVGLVLQGQSYCNLHPQYCRAQDPEQAHDILLQENHDNLHNTQGECIRLVGGMGADIHVMRDDGTQMGDLPWGRDGNEFCQGHQCWRGRSGWAITSTGTHHPAECRLIESLPVAHVGHIGSASPGGRRNDLSRTFSQPDFYHFATDAAGQTLITDAGPRDGGGRIFLARFGEAGKDALGCWTYLLNPRSSWRTEAHIHPFLSPDGRMGFFNSDESGLLQAFMLRGLEAL